MFDIVLYYEPVIVVYLYVTNQITDMPQREWERERERERERDRKIKVQTVSWPICPSDIQTFGYIFRQTG